MLETALLCLALNVYFESRGEPIPGQYAVALVTMNRAGWNEKRVCPEVFKPMQFSWTQKLAYPVGKNYKLTKAGIPKEASAWDTAVTIAETVMAGRMFDITEGATHYHADYVSPRWANNLQVSFRVGKHIFYR